MTTFNSRHGYEVTYTYQSEVYATREDPGEPAYIEVETVTLGGVDVELTDAALDELTLEIEDSLPAEQWDDGDALWDEMKEHAAFAMQDWF